MEKIQEILAKESLTEQDINFLVLNKGSVPQEALVRLGLATAEAVKEPVKSPEPEAKPELSGEAKAAAEVRADQENPELAEKRGRGRKKAL